MDTGRITIQKKASTSKPRLQSSCAFTEYNCHNHLYEQKQNRLCWITLGASRRFGIRCPVPQKTSRLQWASELAYPPPHEPIRDIDPLGSETPRPRACGKCCPWSVLAGDAQGSIYAAQTPGTTVLVLLFAVLPLRKGLVAQW